VHTQEAYVSKALQAGAVGYLLKDADVPELELAVRAVAEGETYLTPAISKQVVTGYVRQLNQVSQPELELTPRQREILQMIAEGRSTQEIAKTLFISEKTVHAHRAQMMHRLGIADITGLIRYAIRADLMAP
jgi:DNA-binding NarL/FixJ family response regulator